MLQPFAVSILFFTYPSVMMMAINQGLAYLRVRYFPSAPKPGDLVSLTQNMT